MKTQTATLSAQKLEPELSWPPAPANDPVLLSPEPFGGVLRAPPIAEATILHSRRSGGLVAIIIISAVVAIGAVLMLGQLDMLTSQASVVTLPVTVVAKGGKADALWLPADLVGTDGKEDLANGLNALRLQMHAAVQVRETAPQLLPKLVTADAPGIRLQPVTASNSGTGPTALPVVSTQEAAAPQPGPTTTEVRAMLERARGMIHVGDIASARRLTEYAAVGGDGNALFALAETFDPMQLARWHVRGVRADVERARVLYQQALGRGVADAGERLTRLP